MAGMAAYGMPVRAQCQLPAPASPSRINPGSAIDPALCCVLWKAYGQAPVAPAPMKSQMPATPNSTTLFVANLTRTATEAEMHAVFGGCAPEPTNKPLSPGAGARPQADTAYMPILVTLGRMAQSPESLRCRLAWPCLPRCAACKASYA